MIRSVPSLLLFLLLGACTEEKEPRPISRTQDPPEKPKVAPPRAVSVEKVLVDRILIACRESRYKHAHKILRTREEARKHAYRLLRLLEGGADFAILKKVHSDDRDPKTDEPLGPWVYCNDGVRHLAGEIPRSSMSRVFGDLVFSMKVGEMGIVAYEPKNLTQGFDVVKRLK